MSAEPVVYADSSQSALAYGDGGDKGRTNQIDRLTGLDVSKPLHFSWSFDGAKVKGYAAQVPGLDVPDLKMPGPLGFTSNSWAATILT